ncbi:MAG: hypothetical protein H6832_18310 [Planctomycetes bacterium]|nr:hypothetical protein [Planctomycetota bacterium]MCB9920361.1 hypothetical protein [Planctomycetota bacterium]
MAILLLLAAAITSGCVRTIEAPKQGDDIVRFMHDPIRIDGKGTIAREDFHRFAVEEVAQSWLPVLALERAVRDHALALGLARPNEGRVRSLIELVHDHEVLRARFPSFPKPSTALTGERSGSSKTCALRLALCLAWLEQLTGTSSDDPTMQRARLDDALVRYGARLEDGGASCAGLTIDALEVWPELLARSDVPWREVVVRRALEQQN